MHIALGGVSLHVRLEGPQDAPVLVLVHSLGTDLRLWDDLVAILSDRYRLLRFDLRGHGGSDAPPGPYSLDLLADDLLGLLAHMKITRAHVVGVSLGALTALTVAVRNPREVAGIVVCNTRVDMPPEFAEGIEARNRLIHEQGMAPVAASSPSRWLSPATLAARPDLAEKVRAMVGAASTDGFIACTEAIRTSTLASQLSAIRLPALFVASTADPGLPVAIMHAMHTEVAGSSFATIAGTGHLSPMEDPAAFGAVLLEFLAAA